MEVHKRFWYDITVGTEEKTILTVNAGSSSLKLVVFGADSLQSVFSISITNIGQKHASCTIQKSDTQAETQAVVAEDYYQAETLIFEQLEKHGIQPSVIGHRIVHSGPDFDGPVALSDDVYKKLAALEAYDPEHMPAALALIQKCAQQLPGVPQVACFDTSFFSNIPTIAKLLPLPRKFEAAGLRRYGFHGLSYTSLLKQFSEQAGEAAAKGRIIMAHLGSGASLAAIKDGRPLDTTMGFTPASGIPMSTRTGDLDPDILTFLQRQMSLDDKQLDHMIHFESGLLGVSGITSDMEELIKRAPHNHNANEAVALFCYNVRKAIGSLAAVLGGVDSLIFSGGIGEQAPVIRALACQELSHLGIALDENRNNSHSFLISSDASAVGVHVLHSDEASIIALQTKEVLEGYHHV